MTPDPQMILLVRLFLLVLFVLLGIPRVRKWIVVHLSTRAELEKIGTSAVQRVPPAASLEAVKDHAWSNRRVEEDFVLALKALGYREAGQYRLREMSGVFVWLWVNTRENVRAVINEHPKAGCWVELVTLYEDGSSCSVTQKPPTGLAHPDWLTKINAENATVQQLHERMVAERPNRFRKELSVETAAEQFEEGWRKYAAWSRGRTVSAEEVKAVAVRRT